MDSINYQNSLWPLIYDQYNSGRHEKELDFYLNEFKNCNGKILEVACGTGMILLEMLKKNIDIYGFDISQEMINKLFKKAENIGITDIKKRVSRQDMKDFNYDNKFDYIFIPARSFLHLTSQEDQINCLKNIYNHLKKNGKLILNFFNPNLKILVSNNNKNFQLKDTYEHPDTKEKIKLYCKQKNNIADQIQNITFRFEFKKNEYITKMKLRWIYKEEFKLLLKISNFKNWELFGDFNKSKFNHESNEMIWKAKK